MIRVLTAAQLAALEAGSAPHHAPAVPDSVRDEVAERFHRS